MRISRLETGLNYLILTVFAVFALIPFAGVILTALSPRTEAAAGFSVPAHPSFRNFISAWTTGHFSDYMLASVIVDVAVVVLSLALVIPAGYAFARMRFPLSGPIFGLIILGLIIPEEAIIIPLYYDMRAMNLTDSYWSLIFPQVAQSLAFGTFWMRASFRTFPQAIIDSARMDGATDFRILRSILVPASRPAITTLILLLAMWTWSEFLIPLVMLSGNAFRTAPLGLAFFSSAHTTDYALLSAAALIIATPIIGLYIFLQRSFIAGMLSGALR
jgi:raffinose/stachyose/melibiose transport system permease protein